MAAMWSSRPRRRPGSVFRVLLPPAQAEPQSEPEVAAQAVAERPLAGRVMVVDDEAMVGDFMAELLDGWGLEVVLQRDPLQALAWLRAVRIRRWTC